MKKILKGIACLVLTASCLGIAFSASGAHASAPAQSKVKKRQAQGRTLYVEHCARCHGGDGRGKTSLGEMFSVPDLTNAEWQSKRGDNRIRSSIRWGRNAMPAFIDKLSKDEVTALVAYVRSLKK